MASSPVSASSQRQILQFTQVVFNTSFITAPVPPTLNENLQERPVFDYDFSRERVFLEIAAAEIAAMKQADHKLSNGIDEDADAELAHQGANLSLENTDADVAAAISASLREY